MNNYRNIVLWVIVGLFSLALYNFFLSSREHMKGVEMAYSDFLTAVDTGTVHEVVIRGHTIHGHLQDGHAFSTFAPPQDGKLVEKLEAKHIKFSAMPLEDANSGFLGGWGTWLPTIFFVGMWIYILRQMQSGNNKAMGFGKSRAKLLNEQKQKVTFPDVAGVDEAKQEVQEIVEFLRDPQKFQKLGGKIPKGVLLMGSPGTGKTLLARAIAGEANVPFFSISGSEFVEMFVGVGASRVRDLFEQAKKNAPCVVFIDEIDAVGRHRGAGMGGGNDEREQTLNQLLVEMDGFEANEGVILIAATNRPDVLDPALLRPGRFDRQVEVPLPDIAGREQILNVHVTRVPLGADVNIRTIARGTPGFSGADLANLINEAALLAARQDKRVVTHVDLEHARDKILMGPERRSMIMTEEEKKLTAYHEAGHAIAAFYSPSTDPIHKATIIPRGRALGMVSQLPENDPISKTRQQLKSYLVICMAGRVTEEMIFGHDNVTTGASSDIEQATRTARSMVTKAGLSSLGPIDFAESDNSGRYLGYQGGSSKNYSDETARKIDAEIRKFIEDAHDEAKRLLTEHTDNLHKLANSLLEYETLTGEEIEQLLTTNDFKKNTVAVKTTKPRSSTPRTKSKEPKEGKESKDTKEKD